MHLSKLDETSYREYQRFLRTIEPSLGPKGEEIPPELKKNLHEMMESAIPPKPMFLVSISNPCTEAYFLRDNKDENIGMAYMTFQKHSCKMVDFAILPKYKGKGIGTEFFNMLIKEVLNPKKCKEIVLNCPYPGAQQFYLKLGFTFVFSPNPINPKMRKKL